MALFKGKFVLVLGGSRGIGAAIVRRFVQDGAAVTFTYSGSPEAAQQLAAETGATAAMTDSADRDAVIARVRDSGPIDVLVVNAGIAIFGDALEQDPDQIDRLLRINVHAPYHASVEAARQMPAGGRIIVIGSVNGDRMPVPGMAAYALSKSALQGMARGLARDFGPRGITINVVQPGPDVPDRHARGASFPGYLPVQFGLRFSAKAAAPSRASALANTGPISAPCFSQR